MVPNTGTSNWKSIAQQVTVEMDSHKLSVLVNQLCAALDEDAERKRQTPPLRSLSEPSIKTAAWLRCVADC